MAEKFDPAKHFRKVKGGQDYLECKWRIIWWREEHPEGYVQTEVVHADYHAGYYVVKAEVGWHTPEGAHVRATAHKSESVKDFPDALEKAETGAVGRALAMLGYGTAQAIELDEGERIVDSPTPSRQRRDKDADLRGEYAAWQQSQAAPDEQAATDTPARAGLAVVREPVDVAALRTQVAAGLAADPDAAGKVPKPAAEMTEAEASKTLAWLQRRARMGVTKPATTQDQGTAEVDADVGSRTEELTAYVNDVDAHLQAMKGTRGPMTADQRGTWASLYTRGQALAGPATGEDARPVTDLKPTELATACSRLVQACLAQLAGSEVTA